MIIIDYRDITSEVCMQCGECCKIYLPVKGDKRYFEFLEKTGVNFEKISENLGRVYLGYCIHLKISDGSYMCNIYNERPQLCRDFNCLAWARYTNTCQKSDLLKKAMYIVEKGKSNKQI